MKPLHNTILHGSIIMLDSEDIMLIWI